MLLASLDADFTVVDPPEFRDYLQACAGRFLRAAESAGPLPSES